MWERGKRGTLPKPLMGETLKGVQGVKNGDAGRFSLCVFLGS